jgi:protein-S-isoprenylcysteine O-methyltransferase Ste14
MISVSVFLAILWVIFWAYWLISAVRSKKTVRNGYWRKGFLVRIVILLLLIWFFRTPNIVSFFATSPNSYVSSIWLDVLAVVFWFVGVGFAVWARVYLGRNWGMPMSLKENPELVTGGPYHYVRHPIYSGILFAIIASALVGNFFWLVAFFGAGIYFMYSAYVEEKIMAREFPNQYPEYKKRTKMLIPFVF